MTFTLNRDLIYPQPDHAPMADDELVVEIFANDERTDGEVSPLQFQEMTDRLCSAIETTYQALSPAATVSVRRVSALSDKDRGGLTSVLRVDLAHPFEPMRLLLAQSGKMRFLEHGLMTVLRWLSEPERSGILGLQQALSVLASGTATDVQSGATAPDWSALSMAVARWQDARESASFPAIAKIRTRVGAAEISLETPAGTPGQAVRLQKLRNPATEMIFIVEMPDYRSTGRWLLRHGATRFEAECAPCPLIDRFHRREVDVRPGDGLHCRVEFETTYGPDHEVVAERYKVVDVIALLPPNQGSAIPHVQQSCGSPETDSTELCEQIEDDFGLLTIRRLPIH